MPFFKNYVGMAITPNLIICSGKASDSLIKHEKVHQMQMIRYGGLINFWVIYFFYYIKGLFKYWNHWDAYRNNPLEIEARKEAIK